MTGIISKYENERAVKPALLRGWKRKCPSCGSGPLFNGYLKVRDECAVCGEELYHQRADDGPAWATILLSGLLMAPALGAVFSFWRPSGLVMALGFSAFFITLSLYLLPRIKGVFVAIQWAKRMHGFGE
jgi:uncharacterized protein (DUF983 family)